MSDNPKQPETKTSLPSHISKSANIFNSPAYLFWKIQCYLLKLANRLRHRKTPPNIEPK